ncbi:hypothetical protein MTO96_043373 [Rhipicephalus appendiculatus]
MMSQSDNDDSISITQWKRKLDLDRPCGAVSSDETCWLCDDCTAWNSVIQALDLELAETKSGTLRLQSVPYEKVDRPSVIIAQEAARFASLLLSRHTCVQELSLTCSIRARSPFERPPFPIHLSPTLSMLIHRRLRLLCITERSSAHLDLRDIHTITGLETLMIRCEGHNQRIAAEVDALLERNRTTLKNFDIWEFGQRREGLAMLESLVACESLTFKANHNKGGMPYMDAVALRVNKSLKELKLQGLDEWSGPYEQSISLARQLLEDECYDRVQLEPCTGAYLRILSPVLVSPQSGIKELSLPETDYLSLESVNALLEALASNNNIKRLTLSLKFYTNQRVPPSVRYVDEE